jgi:hypothetical protein
MSRADFLAQYPANSNAYHFDLEHRNDILRTIDSSTILHNSKPCEKSFLWRFPKGIDVLQR